MTPSPGDTAAPAPARAIPNHHADHPGFAGVRGLAAAACFSIGRGATADLAVRLAGLGPDDDVVDIGCGPGVAARRAAAVSGSVVGVDPAPVMLRVARSLGGASRRGGQGVRYLLGAAESLPLPDDSATVVWSLATVHHWRDLDAGLGEARRVLRAAGRLLVIERRIEPGASGHASHGWTGDHAQRFAELCRNAGFTDVEIGHHRSGRGQVVSLTARAPALAAGGRAQG
ncbi:MAG TPA: class I SAM-dependent methyltransferase [Acidimicrobiales bacterium]|nr:class I SAM-dependent methyltransferase [Acidimicrobiales bacterium]